jgi:hypothetical protein
MNKFVYLLLVFNVFHFSCTSNDDEPKEKNESSSTVDEQSSNCKFPDDTYSATVDYENLETGYSATYTLNVVIEDCQVIQINFPNDGYLDEDHISPADIDEDGHVSVDGEDGKTYEIQIDK